MNANYLKETYLLDFNHPSLQHLIHQENWLKLEIYERIKAIYEYVQNDILFGYNKKDTLPASKVLVDGYGQCNTKAILLMSLLRAVNIPCRLHGFEVTKNFQRGVTTFLINLFAPTYIIHTWVEVFYQGKWLALEGVILDIHYLKAVQNKYCDIDGLFNKYAIATTNLKNPEIEWKGKATYIQKEAIVNDYGYYDSPDDFFKQYSQDFSFLKNIMYMYIGRRIMNYNVKRIRLHFNK